MGRNRLRGLAEAGKWAVGFVGGHRVQFKHGGEKIRMGRVGAAVGDGTLCPRLKGYLHA